MQEMTSAPIGRLFSKYLFPTVTASVSMAAYCIVDVIFVGLQTGRDGLAALNIAMPVFTLYGALAMLLGLGTATTMSVCRGAGDELEARRVFTLGTVAATVLGIIISILSVVFLEDYARLLGSTDHLLQPTMLYMLPISAGGFIFIVSKSIAMIVRNDNGPKLAMIATITGNAMNVVLDYVLMYPLNMGILGASIATLCSPLIALMIMLPHFFKKSGVIKPTKGFWQKARLKRIVKNGTASCLQDFSAGFVILIFNRGLLHWGGELYVAVYAIISNIAFVVKAIFDGIGTAAQPILSFNYGAEKMPRVAVTFKVALFACLGVAAFLYVSFLLFPETIVGWFTYNDKSLVTEGAHALKLYFTCLGFMALNAMFAYFFQSIEQFHRSFIIAILRGFVFVVAGMAIFAPLWQIDGIWLTITFAEGLTTLCVLPIILPHLKKVFQKEHQHAA
jgi:putative MATE family efflux protein